MNRESDAIVKSAAFRQRMQEWGWANAGGARTPQGVAEYMGRERERWGRIVRELCIAPRYRPERRSGEREHQDRDPDAARSPALSGFRR